MRGKNRRKTLPEFPTWMGSNADKIQGQWLPITPADIPASIPVQIGTEFTLGNFAVPVNRYQMDDVSKFMVDLKQALFPFEQCVKLDPKETVWYDFMMTDRAYLYAIMFMAEIYFRGMRADGRLHFDATPHYVEALRLLAEKISSRDQDAMANHTITVVISFAMTADIFGDYKAAEYHVKALQRLVMLRGGLDTLQGDNWSLKAKACRADIGHAIATGQKPLFYSEGVSFAAYITVNSPIARFASPAPVGVTTGVASFIQKLDWRLVNVWNDVREFSMIGNLAYQTKRQLKAEAFNEMVTSILYRLLHLHFGEDHPAEEAVRHGLLSFTMSVFLQWGGIKGFHERLNVGFKASLLRLGAQ